MNKKMKIKKIIEKLENEYPIAKCALVYHSALELLIAARLSAQCTDKRVNLVTPSLFLRFKSAQDFANAKKEEVEKYVKSCGLYKTKAASIVDMCKKIVKDFGGQIPEKLEDLTSLAGIGRKTANLIRGEIFGKPAIIVDTHFSRVTRRLGLHNLKDPLKIEIEIKKLIPEEKSTGFCHRIVFFGRDVCKARNPLCEKCILQNLCEYFIPNKKTK